MSKDNLSKGSLLEAAEAALRRKQKPKKARTVSSIGTEKESCLHRSLKFRYSGEDGETEVLTGTYVCDGRTNSGELIEVQTGSFSPLKEKAEDLCKKNKVRIVHPIIHQKYIELYETDGQLRHRKKSPRKGSIWDVFNSLVYAPELPLLKKLTIELAIVDVIEKRINDGTGSWRRKGVRIADRSVSAWRESVILKRLKDYCQFIPFKKKERFTVRDLTEKAGINMHLARKTLYVLAKMNIIKRVGKQGRALVYKRLT
jgi:hypothetical protein